MQIVSLFCGIVFDLLSVSLQHWSFSILMYFNLSIFSFITCGFGVYIGRFCLTQVHQGLLPYLKHLQFFVYRGNKGSKIIYLHIDIQLFQHNLLKRLFFLHQIFWHPCRKSIDSVYEVLFLNSHFIPLMYTSILCHIWIPFLIGKRWEVKVLD